MIFGAASGGAAPNKYNERRICGWKGHHHQTRDGRARGHAIVDLPSATVLPAGLSDASQE
jgi:hypothetical protein